uniref:A-kinase anchoring protein 11 n=1 Tax=Hucho hucho TaxID=62062 RepID=A0A4W5JF09_9TELE
MNPHRFDQRTLPANVKKPTPLRCPLPPGSPFGSTDSPRLARTSCEESGGPLFSPVSSSAFSPLGDGGALDLFWKTEGEVGDMSELRKPQDLCSLYKTYSDFASSLSKEILGSVCGYQSPVDLNDNKNLSCVCHKEFQNQSGHVMKLSEIQETVTLSKLQQKPQSLKDGIQRFATDLVEMSLGSALRDLQKGMSSCTTTLCHLAARLTSSVFQMAFQEIGMRHAYVLKERAINGLAGFLVGEAVSGALKDFLMVKKQMFNSTVTQFSADLAEELVFEGMMEVCQFSHPSTPLTPSDWSFGVGEDDDEEVVSSYASDLSESVLQEAFIELSQADVAFSTQAAISVSVDNICYVSAVDTHTICSTAAGHQAFHVNPAEEGPGPSGEDGCTVKKALFCVSGMASCVPVPQAGQAISHLHDSEEICQCKTSLAQTSPKRCCSSENRVVTTTSSDATTATQTDLLPKTRFQNFSGNMVDMIVSEACELMTAKKMKKKVEDCADFLSKTIVGRGPPSGQEGSVTDQTSLCSLHPPSQTPGGVSFESGSKTSRAVVETRPVMMDTLEVPGLEMGGWGSRKMATVEEMVPSPGHKSNRTPGTPPSTPQQPSEVSQEKQIKQFSKKLKGKLAKEFSTATPPPTPQYQPGPEPKESTSETDKADFMLKLMRSLSEEADGNEEEEEEEEGGVEGVNSVTETGSRMQPELNLLVGGHKMADKGALNYAERLACHIVSMATEIDTLGGVEDGGRRTVEGREERSDSMAQFSAQTLNTLWIYAGEVAGEVISDVKRIMWSGQCRHSALKQGSQEQSWECPHHHQPQPSEHSRDCRVGRLAEQWSGDLLSSVLHPSTSTPSSGLSSDYPSCESVTDEYAGYLIRVLKKEGGSRELVLDQYASRLAYRSIKLGLAHAARNMKKRPSSSRHHSSRRLQQNGCRGPNAEPSLPRNKAGRVGSPSRDIDDGSQREYMELVNFAESLACNITCDVTRKLCVPSVRLPKSRTDSCLYKKSKLEDMAENLIRNSFSCPLLSKEGNSRQYHSTGSLYDGGYSSGVMEVLEHYARNIVDDTLEMGLASVGNPAQQGPYRHLHSERRAVGSALGETTCQYCRVRKCLFCSQPNRQHLLGAGEGQRRRLEGDVGGCGLEIPEIHINLDRRAVFAEEMVTTAMEGAKRELSNTSLNADSGIGHDGHSFAESLTTEIMTSALSNTCQTTNLSFPGREATESTVSQQLSLSVGDDSLGSWSRLSFEDEHPDETSSFLHLSDSEGTEDKELETKDESCGSVHVGQAQAYRLLLVVNSELREMTPDPQHMTFDTQLRSMLQWAAASMADLPMVQLSPSGSRELQQVSNLNTRYTHTQWYLSHYCGVY